MRPPPPNRPGKLKVLVATAQTQGDEPGDFSFVPEGELVGRYGVVCASSRACGCGRAFSGFTTHRGTTSAMIVERAMTEADWRAALYVTLEQTGWSDSLDPDELAEEIDEIACLDLHSLDELPIGTVVGRRAELDRCWFTDELVLRRHPLP